MMIQFQTQVEYYENKIPVNIQIFITRGLFSLTTTSEISEIRQNLVLKLPVILKKKSIAYSKLKLRISSNLPQKISKVIDIHKLESPIVSAVCDALTDSTQVQQNYPSKNLSLTPELKLTKPNLNQNQSKIRRTNLKFAAATINILQSQDISAIYMVSSQALSLSIAKYYKIKYCPNLFIFNFYKHPELINTLAIFLEAYTDRKQKIALIGIENLSTSRQETLFQLVKDRISSCLFLIKPCRCGNFLNNNKQCLCHSLIRSKNLDALSGELISAIDFNISFFESNSKPGTIISDFFYTTLSDQLFDMESFQDKHLLSINICPYIKSYIEDLYSCFNLQPSLVKSLVRFACILAYLRGRHELLFSDIFDVINLQSNWYKYAKHSEFIQHRPMA